MKEILFVRHGATAGNLERRYIGRTDEPLCALGIRQAQTLAAKKLRADRLFVSPALRTRQTAELVFPGLKAVPIPDLWETDFGLFENRTGTELWDHEPSYRVWVDGGCTGPVPGGESRADFQARCCRGFLAALEEVREGETCAFVIHGGCIMAILAHFAGGDFYDYHIGNGEVLHCQWDGAIDNLQLTIDNCGVACGNGLK